MAIEIPPRRMLSPESERQIRDALPLLEHYKNELARFERTGFDVQEKKIALEKLMRQRLLVLEEFGTLSE